MESTGFVRTGWLALTVTYTEQPISRYTKENSELFSFMNGALGASYDEGWDRVDTFTFNTSLDGLLPGNNEHASVRMTSLSNDLKAKIGTFSSSNTISQLYCNLESSQVPVYLIEGGGSKDWHQTKRFMWSKPEAFKLLLDKLAVAVGKHLQAQINAGALAVQLFDTWAGALGRDDYIEFALPAVQKVFSMVSGAPTLYFSRDSNCFLDYYPQVGADAFALDWRADWAQAKRVLGDVPLQGNLDPIALQAPPSVIRDKVHQILRDAGPLGHIFNLGHGCTPQTPIEGVQAALDAVHEWDWSKVG